MSHERIASKQKFSQTLYHGACWSRGFARACGSGEKPTWRAGLTAQDDVYRPVPSVAIFTGYFVVLPFHASAVALGHPEDSSSSAARARRDLCAQSEASVKSTRSRREGCPASISYPLEVFKILKSDRRYLHLRGNGLSLRVDCSACQVLRAFQYLICGDTSCQTSCATISCRVHSQINAQIGSAGFAAHCAAVNYQAAGQELPALHCNTFCVEPSLITPLSGMLSSIIPFQSMRNPSLCA